MPDFTPNLNLTKQTPAENIDIDILNANLDKIDTSALTLNQKVDAVSATMTSLSDPRTVVSGSFPLGLTGFSGTPQESTLRYKLIGKTAFCTYALQLLSSTTDGTGFRFVLPWDLWSVASQSGIVEQAVGVVGLTATPPGGSSIQIYSGTVLMKATSDGAKSTISFAMLHSNTTTTGPFFVKFGTTTPSKWDYTKPINLYATFTLEIP